jgi:ComF family protein
MSPGWLQRLAAAAPSRCALCGAWPAQPVCAACRRQFARPQPRCLRCALPLPPGPSTCGACLAAPPPLDACFAAVPYAYPWAGLVARFKFEGEPAWAATLAALVLEAPPAAGEIAAADLLLPMPLSPRRLAARGFNQALLLARGLAPARTDPGLLLRLRETGPQAALDRKQRQANVRGAFGLEPLRHAQVRGKAVLLVDDVMTSGASLHAAAAVLRQAGAARVAAAVVARTDAPH